MFTRQQAEERTMADFTVMKEGLLDGDAQIVEQEVKRALEQGCSAEQVLQEGLISGMDIIAGKFKKNEVFVPEVLLAARAMKAGMGHLEAMLAKTGVQPLGKILIGTVKGDLHDIGKNLVVMMLRGAGFEVHDIGIDQPPENFVKQALENNYSLVGCSALITTTMPMLKSVIDAFSAAGQRGKVKIAVGGAPVTREFAEQIGADGFADNAAGAVDVFKGFLKSS